jgi:hypothetical protein
MEENKFLPVSMKRKQFLFYKMLNKKTFINITFAGDFADIFHRVADLNL